MRTTSLPRLMTLGALPVMLTFCQTTGSSGPSPETVACRAFDPITWSEDDTRETIQGVKGHNAAYKAVCG